jgi:hypothetical protein
MSAPPADRTAVLVVRAWREDETLTGLRARVTAVRDVVTGESVITTCATVEDICQAVRAWLDEFTAVG